MGGAAAAVLAAALLTGCGGPAATTPTTARAQPRRAPPPTPDASEVPVTVEAPVQASALSCLARVGAGDAPGPTPTPGTEPAAGRARGCLAIVPENRMGAMLRLVELEVRLDDRQLVHADEQGAVIDRRPLPRVVAPVPAGAHEVSSTWIYRGGGYGIFSLSLYRFVVRSRHRFELAQGTALLLSVVALEVGRITTPLEERPRVVHVETRLDAGPSPKGPPEAPSG